MTITIKTKKQSKKLIEELKPLSSFQKQIKTIIACNEGTIVSKSLEKIYEKNKTLFIFLAQEIVSQFELEKEKYQKNSKTIMEAFKFSRQSFTLESSMCLEFLYEKFLKFENKRLRVTPQPFTDGITRKFTDISIKFHHKITKPFHYTNQRLVEYSKQTKKYLSPPNANQSAFFLFMSVFVPFLSVEFEDMDKKWTKLIKVMDKIRDEFLCFTEHFDGVELVDINILISKFLEWANGSDSNGILPVNNGINPLNFGSRDDTIYIVVPEKLQKLNFD